MRDYHWDWGWGWAGGWAVEYIPLSTVLAWLSLVIGIVGICLNTFGIWILLRRSKKMARFHRLLMTLAVDDILFLVSEIGFLLVYVTPHYRQVCGVEIINWFQCRRQS